MLEKHSRLLLHQNLLTIVNDNIIIHSTVQKTIRKNKDLLSLPVNMLFSSLPVWSLKQKLKHIKLKAAMISMIMWRCGRGSGGGPVIGRSEVQESACFFVQTR